MRRAIKRGRKRIHWSEKIVRNRKEGNVKGRESSKRRRVKGKKSLEEGAQEDYEGRDSARITITRLRNWNTNGEYDGTIPHHHPHLNKFSSSFCVIRS